MSESSKILIIRMIRLLGGLCGDACPRRRATSDEGRRLGKFWDRGCTSAVLQRHTPTGSRGCGLIVPLLTGPTHRNGRDDGVKKGDISYR